LLIFVAYLNYLTDSYLAFAASALAANTVCRSACGAAAPLFTQYMFDSLGVGGGGSLIAGVACLLAPIPFIFYKYGEPIRKRSKFTPTEPKPSEREQQDESPRERTGSESTQEELELDDVQGVPNPRELEEDIREKNRSGSDPSSKDSTDRYLDASGMEKAEPTSTR
jgi:DHA1 family multidrug resistance protein-like MFS transporter